MGHGGFGVGFAICRSKEGRRGRRGRNGSLSTEQGDGQCVELGRRGGFSALIDGPAQFGRAFLFFLLFPFSVNLKIFGEKNVQSWKFNTVFEKLFRIKFVST
jgi:hypothetical protein